jgi:hypothetical protein
LLCFIELTGTVTAPAYAPAEIVDTSASKLNTTSDLASLGLPALQGSYHGNALIDALLADVNHNHDVNVLVKVEARLQALAPCTYKKPNSSEREYTNPNLVRVMQIIHSNLTHGHGEVIEVVQQSAAAHGKMYLCSSGSNPECTLTFAKQLTFGLITSVAKDVFAGPQEACAQSVAFAGSYAVLQVHGGVPRNQVLVPFIMSFSDSLQFGAAYIVDSNFPCFAMLSTTLSLLSWESRQDISRWLLGLARFCDRQVPLLSVVVPPPRAEAPKQGQLNVPELFLKHVAHAMDEVRAPKMVRNDLCHLMQIFQRLHVHPECRSFVVFPLGTMGMPKRQGEAFHPTVCDALKKAHPQEEAVVTALPPGWPIVIYPRLTGPEWQCAARLSDLYLHRESFLEQLTAMLAHVAAAGVIHLDVRLANIMVKMPPTHSSSSAAAEIQLKLIDWDMSSRVGHPINDDVVAAFANDPRKRYPVNLPIATAAYHDFFLTRIDQLLRRKEAEASAGAEEEKDQVVGEGTGAPHAAKRQRTGH